ncbi:protein ECT2 isoform 12 [Mus musculus]|uniref:protein ECT2 isoform 12 n=1 Tax=Mus musculus TaxID=10090 RepID=UPI0020CABB72|nr:protein ECT2 isoform 12 [Mus musculus]
MADDSVLPSPSEITSLADSSVFDSKVAEMSKENLCLASTSNVDEEMPQVEARVIMVQDAGKQEELLKALKTIKIMEVPVIKIKESCPGKSEEKLIKSIINMDDLEDLIANWDESRSIGDIFLKYAKDLVKTYPPFVNFFEMSKEMIIKCEKQKPRFHAFLKINQAKPECGRQSLVELLIRPVQRLPSVALLLNDLKKHTADENPDKSTLEKAIGSLKEVMTHINEDKRKTEAQKQIFDVVYEVDGCPANLLSSHRSLVQRVETVSLGEHPCDRGEQVTLFLFNDCLEIARKRHKVIGTFRSPHDRTRPPASLKHIHLMPLSQIKKVLDIRETEDCHNAFALLVRPPTEQANVLLSFQMTSEELPKESWLKMLCRHVANTICKADAENLMYVADPESFEVNTKDMDSTLSRASRAIKKTSKKVTRAFSFSKTPKRALRMALSSSHSSEGRSPPSSGKLAVSRLSSTSSLAGIPSPSLVSLPSFFERRSHTLSRSTTHLI